MKKIYRVIAVLLLVCMLPVIPAMASSEEVPSGKIPSGEASSEEPSSEEPAASGEMIASGEPETSEEAEASEEAEESAEPAVSEELDSQSFQTKIPYNDTTYGFGNVTLKVTGSVFSDGTYQVDSVKCFGYELISYMTDDYYTELCGLLQDAGIVYEA